MMTEHTTEAGYIDGLMQERSNSIADALELRLSCTNLSICVYQQKHVGWDLGIVFIYKNPLHLDVVDWYLQRMGDKAIPDEALSSLE